MLSRRCSAHARVSHGGGIAKREKKEKVNIKSRGGRGQVRVKWMVVKRAAIHACKLLDNASGALFRPSTVLHQRSSRLVKADKQQTSERNL